MSDETGNSLYMALLKGQSRSSFFRRKRKHVGKTWRPELPRIQEGASKLGLWCPVDKIVHSYNGPGKLGIDYEYRNGQLTILWLCPKTQNVLGDTSDLTKRN